MLINNATAALGRAVDPKGRWKGVHVGNGEAFATDGLILAYTAAEGTATLDGAALRKAAPKVRKHAVHNAALGVAEVTDDPPVPIFYQHMVKYPEGATITRVVLSPDYLRMLADMAKDIGAVCVHMAIVDGQDGATTAPVRFAIKGLDDVRIDGLLMPMFTTFLDVQEPKQS